MFDFLKAALPFVIIGLCLAILSANYKEGKKTYLSEGMSIGMCFGVAIAASLKMNLGLGISLGMLIGEAIGISKEKK